MKKQKKKKKTEQKIIFGKLQIINCSNDKATFYHSMVYVM